MWIEQFPPPNPQGVICFTRERLVLYDLIIYNMGKEYKIAEKQIVNNLMTARQVVMELPRENLEAEGGIKGLISQVKYNLTESLRAYGLDCWVSTIESINVDGLDSIDDFYRAIQQKAIKC